MNRRRFIRQSGGLLVAAGFSELPSWTGISKQIPVGVQLYSVRNAINQQFESTIEAIATMGYRYIESASYHKKNRTIYGLPPADFRQKLQSNQLVPLSAHVTISLSEADRCLDDFATAGVKYLVCPSPKSEFKKSAQGYYKFAEELNRIGEIANKKGILFGYHNHSFEFTRLNDEIPYDILLENTDPKNVFFQLDLGHIIKAGVDPVSYFKKYPKRFKLWHMRDVNTDNSPAVLGKGKVAFKDIFAHRKLAGFETGIVETQPAETGEMSNIQQSIHFLREHKLY